jgi:hypothetical protein
VQIFAAVSRVAGHDIEAAEQARSATHAKRRETMFDRSWRRSRGSTIVWGRTHATSVACRVMHIGRAAHRLACVSRA